MLLLPRLDAREVLIAIVLDQEVDRSARCAPTPATITLRSSARVRMRGVAAVGGHDREVDASSSR